MLLVLPSPARCHEHSMILDYFGSPIDALRAAPLGSRANSLSEWPETFRAGRGADPHAFRRFALGSATREGRIHKPLLGGPLLGRSATQIHLNQRSPLCRFGASLSVRC